VFLVVPLRLLNKRRSRGQTAAEDDINTY